MRYRFLNLENLSKNLSIRTVKRTLAEKSSLVTKLFKKVFLKVVSTIFYQIFISHQMIAFKNYEKCFLFYPKSSSRSQDIQIFVFQSSPLFPHVSHCFKDWSKINLKVYDVINCLNKNLITHIAWYIEKEKGYDIETFSIGRILNKEHFYRKVMPKMHTKS